MSDMRCVWGGSKNGDVHRVARAKRADAERNSLSSAAGRPQRVKEEPLRLAHKVQTGRYEDLLNQVLGGPVAA